ncbi:MAG: Hsp20 family protein [Bacteriovoracaceae bacterium]
MKAKVVLFMVVTFLTNTLFAQGLGSSGTYQQQRAMQQAFEDDVRRHQELMDRLVKEAFSGDSFGDSSEEMKALLNSFMNESMDKSVDDNSDDNVTVDNLMEEFRKQFNGFGGSRLEDLKWEETKDSRILSFTSKNLKEDSFKIEIKDQSITIQSDIEQNKETKDKMGATKSVNKSSFKQLIAIPHDVDADSAKIDKVEDKIKISFKKTTNNPAKKEPIKTTKHNPNVI